MFNVGETVSYGVHGICTIDEICEKDLFGERKEYYKLSPIYDNKTVFFIPSDNLHLIRKILNKKQIDQIIACICEEYSQWMPKDEERKSFCQTAIDKGNHKELLKVIYMLHERQKELKPQKKHIHISDERFLKMAEKMINEEFSYVLNIPVDGVYKYIKEELKKEAASL